jgi:hypothetical protein
MSRYCEVCRRIIDPERAEALPETRLCIDHAREIAKYGGEFTLNATSETISKQGSLKKNYGGINVSKSRNQQAIERLIEDGRNQD